MPVTNKKQIERMQKVEKPREEDVCLFPGPLEPLFPGSKWVLEAEHLKIGYESRFWSFLSGCAGDRK